MKENLQSVLALLEKIEVHGRENMIRLLACMNTIKDMIGASSEGGEKDGNKDH